MSTKNNDQNQGKSKISQLNSLLLVDHRDTFPKEVPRVFRHWDGNMSTSKKKKWAVRMARKILDGSSPLVLMVADSSNTRPEQLTANL